MRVAFVGASDLAVATARLLIDAGEEVVIIESERARIDALSDELDCSFLHGDGTKPDVLREVGTEQTDVLFCVTADDHTNIIAAMVGKSLDFARIIASIRDPAFEVICETLGVMNVIIPTQTIARYLADSARGVDVIELSTMIKGDARFFSFVVRADDAWRMDALELGEHTRAVCSYRDGRFRLAADDVTIEEGDEVVLVTDRAHLSELEERWSPGQAEDDA